jgi:CheY-like chemotaxis protein
MIEKKRILLIDDEPNFTFFVRKNLEQTGEFEVIAVNSGEEGVDMAVKKKPDLILLDVVMPKISGPDVAEFLLHNPDTREIPLIFLTAVVTKNETGLEWLKEIGGHNFVAKPVDTTTLVTSIKKILNCS